MTAARLSNPLSALCVAPDGDGARALEAALRALPGWELDWKRAGSPDEALAALAAEMRDLVLLELPLPGADALALLAQIRQLHPKTAVVVVTPGADETVAVACMQNGALDYIRYRDLTTKDLAALARRVLEVRYLVDQSMELRQVTQMKNEFIANVSHELRTPLSVIIGFAESIKTGGLGPVTEPQLKALDSIGNRAEELLRTLNQILRIGEGQQRLLLKPLDLRALVEEAVARAPRELSRKEMRADCALPAAPVWVRADAEKLAIVLENLLSNAAKFGPGGSTVRLGVVADQQGVTLTVADDGPGVPREMLPRVFENFGAAANGPTRDYRGLGLGLPLSKRIVEQHGGRIWLESPDRRGCKAVVTLPLSLQDSPPLPVTTGPRFEKKRVLIVEDNPELVDVLLLFMSGISGNLDLAAARSGFEALEQIKDHRPDLIIMDVMMPGMDGFEVIERLRRAPATAQLPVLVLTGYADAAARARERGAQDVLLKPFDKKAFCEKVLGLLRVDKEPSK